MNYFSTRDHKKLRNVSFASAVMQGLAPDGGLFMPENIPLLPKSFFSNLRDHSPEEIASTIASAFIAEEIPGEALKKIIEETLNFPIPLQKIDEDIFMLELFHGPTMAFKDVGARFMARVMGYFLEKEKKKAKVIVATSGDTGSAVASGFYNLEGIEVYILYPSKKISP
ncbi:MAG TPA: pyridoxal-phosphate dependent enzyme, partial [Bacteroidia bacterium]